MLERENIVRERLTKLGDACLACAALASATFIRALYPNDWGGLTERPSYYWPLAVVCLSGFPLILSALGFYTMTLRRTRLETIWLLAKGCAALFILAVMLQFAFKLEYSRAVLTGQTVGTFLLVLLREEIMGRVQRSSGVRRGFARRVLVIGCADDLEALSRQISLAHHVEMVDSVDIQCVETRFIEQLIERLHQHAVNSVVVSVPLQYLSLAEKVVHVCEEEGVETILLADFFAQKISSLECSRLFGHPVLVYGKSSAKIYENVGKRCVDLVGASLLLVLLAPILAIVACAIKLGSCGPVLFRQVRAGVNGRQFTMLKFRTMVVNAEDAKKALWERNEMSGPVFKLKNDPRITYVGRFLRKYSVDEIPQLWNVVRGEMSLVGPRPLPIEEVKRFENRAYRRRMSVKPGLTCVWQISGRSDISDFDHWVRLDIQYIDTWSLWSDLKILLLTIPAVLSGRGAK